MTTAASPLVSIVINTLNRAKWLDDAITSLRGLDYEAIEVVVVNGPSVDETSDVLERWSGRIKIGHCDVPNLSVSRNVGISLASGEIIAFIDDDAAPHPQWISRLVDGFRDPKVGAVGGFTIDNTGVRWQVRKTVCDRFGNAYNVSEHFDERPLCRPGTPFYPSLLGTNSAFRASALREIGGFDHTFAYMLDETDVCLRLVDAGWRVVYEPSAMVFHQFAASHIRSPEKIPRTLYPSSVSKAYFIMRHGARTSPGEAAAEMERFRSEILQANAWLARHGRFGDEHRFSLDQDLLQGIETGLAAARSRNKTSGDLEPAAQTPFLPFQTSAGLRIALVSQGYPPQNEAGIARWTAMAAEGLARRGHQVHVLTRTDGEETVEFRDGLWLHKLRNDPGGALAIQETFDVPPNVADWAARVRTQLAYLKSFGVNLVSFPIWDLEGIAAFGDPDLTPVVTLHTTYAMTRPFKPEWDARPLFGHFTVDRMIRAERELLGRAPRMIANSRAVMQSIQDHYQINVRDRSVLVPHGVPDPLATRSARAESRARAVADGAVLRVLFVGRFEPRKGFDIAAEVAAILARRQAPVEVWFAGDDLELGDRKGISADLFQTLKSSPNVRFLGSLSRDALDDAYVDCDIALAPSRFESFGLVGIEAMAAGRPVLTLSGSGVAEVLDDGVTGKAWPESPNVAKAIADEILRLDAQRPALIEMGRNARREYERCYTVETMVDGLEAAYRGALGVELVEAAE